MGLCVRVVGLCGLCGPYVCRRQALPPAAFRPLPAHSRPHALRRGAGRRRADAGGPAAAATEAEVKAEQQALAKQISMSAVNVTPKGQTAIGFTDRSVNPPANYYLRVGESANGWTVKHADFDDELATLEKDGVAITLKLGEGLVDAPAAGTTPAPPPALAAAGVPRPATAAAHGTPTAAQSFVDRLRERAVQKSQAEREAEARMREQFERLARETAAREIQRRQEEEALAAEERALLEQQAR